MNRFFLILLTTTLIGLLGACSKPKLSRSSDGSPGLGRGSGSGGGGPSVPGPFSCSGDFLTAAPFADGNGSLDSPFKICTATQFKELSKGCNTEANTLCNSMLELSSDINLDTQEIVPIGTPETPFEGSFNGKGYSIKNISMTDENGETVFGLFRILGLQASISNLKLTIKNVISDGNMVGGLAGQNLGSISRVSVRGEKTLGYHVESTKDDGGLVGGLVGVNGGVISESSADLRVRGANATAIGALVGMTNNTSEVSNSYANGISEGHISVGGLIGRNSGIVSDCYSNTIVKGSINVGGLIGKPAFPYSVKNSFWNTTTSGISEGSLALGFELGKGFGRSHYDLTKKITFDNEDEDNDWNFNAVWSMPDSQKTPVLTWEKSNADLKLHTLVKDGRKIGFSDTANFTVWGFCKGHGTEISTSGAASGSTSCNGGQWLIQLDLSGAPDGEVTIDFTSGDTVVSRTFVKSSDFCSTRMGYTQASAEQDWDGAYIICTKAQWNQIGNALAAGDISSTATIKLYNNIDFGDGGTELIGGFQNLIDGNGFRLSNIIDTHSVFGIIENLGTGANTAGVVDLGVENSRLTELPDNSGGIIRRSNSPLLSNLYFQGVVSGLERTGGIVGVLREGTDGGCAVSSRGALSNSTFLGAVHGTSEVGGLVGKLSVSSSCFDTGGWPIVSTSSSKGAVRGVSQVGGIVGQSSGRITDTYNSGSVIGTEDEVGGIVGHLHGILSSGEHSISDIKKSISAGSVTGRDSVGGVIGYSNSRDVQLELVTTATAYGRDNVGGAVGKYEARNTWEGGTNYIYDGTIESNYSLGDVIATGSNAGGLVGSGVVRITNSASHSNVFGNDNAGGIFGQFVEVSDDALASFLSPTLDALTRFSGNVEVLSSGSAGPIVGDTSLVLGSSAGAGTENLATWDDTMVGLVNTSNVFGQVTSLEDEDYLSQDYLNDSSNTPFSNWNSLSLWNFQAGSFPRFFWEDSISEFFLPPPPFF